MAYKDGTIIKRGKAVQLRVGVKQKGELFSSPNRRFLQRLATLGFGGLVRDGYDFCAERLE